MIDDNEHLFYIDESGNPTTDETDTDETDTDETDD